MSAEFGKGLREEPWGTVSSGELVEEENIAKEIGVSSCQINISQGVTKCQEEW